MKILRYLNYFRRICEGYFISLVIKNFKKTDVYLISERENEAEDNGYHLFKYIRLNYPDVEVYYLINKNSKNYKKLKFLGNVIEFDSLKHYTYYFLSKKHISAFQFFGVPNNPLIWLLEEKSFFKKKRIFLQHGITKEYLSTLCHEKKGYDIFICGAKPEYEYIRNNFGYPLENVVYTGFSRYDSLHEKRILKKQIILIPTWRQWLGMTASVVDSKLDLEKLVVSNYYKTYNSLLNNSELIKILENNNYELLFYLHPEAQRFREYFKSKSRRIKIIAREEVELQELMKVSEILITDYSSVAFDFGYMKKPVLYYQFDSEEYYEKHYSRGYFDYSLHGFGPVMSTEINLLKHLEHYIKTKKIEDFYKERIKSFFELYDTNNSKRIFEAIKNI